MESCTDLGVLKGCEIRDQIGAWLRKVLLSTIRVKLITKFSSELGFHAVGNFGLNYQQFPAWNLGTEPRAGVSNQIGN